jgi:hypothetical protein
MPPTLNGAVNVDEARRAAQRALAAWAWECLRLRRAGLDRPSVRCLGAEEAPAARRKAA